MTSADPPQPTTLEPQIAQAEPPTALLEEVLSSEGPATRVENLALVGSAQLARLVSDAVTATPGVVRVEPTLRNAVTKLTTAAHNIVTGISRTTPHDEPDRYLAVDGVSIVIRDNHADVNVDLVVDTTQPARNTAHLANTNIKTTIREAGLVPGHATIRILVVDCFP